MHGAFLWCGFDFNLSSCFIKIVAYIDLFYLNNLCGEEFLIHLYIQGQIDACLFFNNAVDKLF